MKVLEKIKEYALRKKNSKVLISNINIDVVEGFFDKITDIICITDYDGKIEYINNGEIYNKYKKLKEVLLYDQYNELVYEEIISKTLDDGSFIGEVKLNKDNTKINVYIASYNMPSQGRILIYIKNLNEHFEKELQLQKEIEKKDEYLRTKDLFIANLSHEIRTPINIIIGMLYFLKSTELNEKQIEYIGNLEQASNLLLEIVKNILDLSKDKQNVVVNNNINFNLKAFLNNLNHLFEQKVKDKNLQFYINTEYDTDINIYADKTRIGQIFLNLINNSIKYTDKGYIEVTCKKVEENNFSYKLQFCIKDTGIGIKREDSLKIFTEFQQAEDPTTKETQGTGMGLAITKKIIESMDGKIWVESSVGLGSKFYFEIQVNKATIDTQEKEEIDNQKIIDDRIEEVIKESISILENAKKDKEENSYPNAEQTTNQMHNKKILLVEDNIINQEITKKILEEMNIICETSIDGTECLKHIENVGKDYYDLILMDIHMPRHNGYEISRILKNNMDVKTPIIALTATNITQEVIEDNREYISCYIQKPIMPLEFKRKIQEILLNTKNVENKLSFIDSYDEVMERLGNNEKMLEKIINIFYATYVDIEKDLECIKDMDEKYIYIHSLKGAMGNLGCKNIFKQLEDVEFEIKTENTDKKLTKFLSTFAEILKELRESQYVKSKINKILVIDSDKTNLEKIKNNLYKYFEVFTAEHENETCLILDTQNINAIIIKDLDDVNKEIELIKLLKSKDEYKDIPLILFDKNEDLLLKQNIIDINVDEFIEKDIESNNLKWHIENAISQKQNELKMKKDLSDYNKEIKNVYDFLYSSLVNLTAYKSQETGGHLLRTKEYMKEMLTKYEAFYKEGLFIENKTIEDIAIAATLHDIGKVGIPDHILNKPGRLTDEEYEIMKQHVVIGRNTLEGTYGDKLSNSVLQYAKDIVYHHHEKFDGTGYPEGLKDEEITVISKIMSVIDVYDALVNDRVYKKAMPYEEAEEYIISQSGKAFDPKVINIFRLVKDDFKRINNENKDNTIPK